MALPLLLTTGRPVLADRVLAPPALGGDTALAKRRAVPPSGGEQILKDPFADLADEFDYTRGSDDQGLDSGGYFVVTKVVGAFVLATLFAGTFRYISSQAASEADSEEGICSADGREAPPHQASAVEVTCTHKVEEDFNTDELLVEHKGLALHAEQQLHQGFAPELEEALACESKTAWDSEYEQAMDSVYDSLFEELWELEGSRRRQK